MAQIRVEVVGKTAAKSVEVSIDEEAVSSRDGTSKKPRKQIGQRRPIEPIRVYGRGLERQTKSSVGFQGGIAHIHRRNAKRIQKRLPSFSGFRLVEVPVEKAFAF